MCNPPHRVMIPVKGCLFLIRLDPTSVISAIGATPDEGTKIRRHLPHQRCRLSRYLMSYILYTYESSPLNVLESQMRELTGGPFRRANKRQWKLWKL